MARRKDNTAAERMRRYRERGEGEDIIVLPVMVNRWAASDLMIEHRLMELLDKGDRNVLAKALAQYLLLQCTYARD